MTTYEINSPAAAERYFDQSFVGDMAAFIAAIARKVRTFTGVVAEARKLAHEAEARR